MKRTSIGQVFGAIGAGLVLAVGLVTFAGAGNGPVLPAPTLDPTSGPPGTVITISGTNCVQSLFLGSTGVAPASILPNVTGQVNFTPTPVEFGPIAPAGDGTWSVQVTVPADAQPGAATVQAQCNDGGPGPVSVSGDVGTQQVASVPYTPTVFTVTAAAPQAVSAQPTSTG